MIRSEWKKLFQNKIMIVVLTAIVVIPTIYTTLFLGSMWDPYGKIGDLPVAVVNQDQPVSYNGKQLDVGATLVKELKDNKSLDFHFVNASDASQGLKDGTYYMVITVPRNFSSNASTLLNSNPQKMELKYETNPGTNYIASKMSDTALTKIKDGISEEVTKEYTQTLFDKFSEVGTGMAKASNGAGQLSAGAEKAAEGNKKITQNLKLLADSTLTFQSGSEDLCVGLKKYVDGVTTVNSGVEQLSNGINSFGASAANGTEQLSGGAQSLSDGLTQYTNGVAKASAGSASLAANNDTLNAGASSLSSGIAQVRQGSAAVLNGLQTLSGTIGSSMTPQNQAQISALENGLTAMNTNLQNLDLAAKSGALNSAALQAQLDALAASSNKLLPAGSQTISQLSAGLGSTKAALDRTGTTQSSMGLIQGMDAVNSGLDRVQDGTNGLAGGIRSYTNGVSAIHSGLFALNKNSGTLLSGAKALDAGIFQLKDGTSSGISQLKAGADQLASGTNRLAANSSTLLSGMNQLNSGAARIQDGADRLNSGSAALGSGLSSLSSGSAALKTSLSAGADQVENVKAGSSTISMFSSPVQSEKTEFTTVENNGDAMAAYMMSVGLWVGCIAFCIMYPLTKYEGELKSGIRWWVSKASIAYLLAVGQALAMVVLLNHIDGFSPLNMGNTILVACVGSLAFMAMMFFFNICCGKVGSFIMLIYMVVQLAGSAGTYPVEISGNFVAGIHKYLPFTYTVEAFRKTICGSGDLTGDLWILGGLVVVFSLLSLLVFQIRTAKIRKGKPLFLSQFEKAGLC